MHGASVMTVNADCMMTATGQGPDNSGRVDLDTNVLSTKVPVPPIGLESYIGVLNKANLTAWGQAQFVNLHSYVTGSLCIVTHNLPGPCITYVDGLDPNEDYAVWLVQRCDVSSSFHVHSA